MCQNQDLIRTLRIVAIAILEVGAQRNEQAVRRRQVLGAATVAAGGLAVLGAAPAAAAPSIGEVGINPPEDLMREHGVLNRVLLIYVLLIYKEASRRIEAGEPPPAQVVDEAAWVVRRFVEDYHEALEERYVFPTLSDAGRLTSITPELCLQQVGQTRQPAAPDRVVAGGLVGESARWAEPGRHWHGGASRRGVAA